MVIRVGDLIGVPLFDNFLLLVYSNNDSSWNRFRYITTFTVYMTDCEPATLRSPLI